MVYKKLGVMMLAGALGVSMLAGCAGKEDRKENVTESVGTEAVAEIAGTETGTQIEDSQMEEPQYPQITSDGKVKDYNSVVTVDDSAYELYTYLDDVTMPRVLIRWQKIWMERQMCMIW